MTLEQLILTRMYALDVTYRQVTALARERLDDPRWSANIHHMAHVPIAEFPRVRTLRGLAAALDVPLRTVVDACAETLALHEDTPRDRDSRSGDSYWLYSPVPLDADSSADIRNALPDAPITSDDDHDS